MNLDYALLYPLAGVFSIVLSLPLLIFWRPGAIARLTVILVLLGSILLSRRLFDLSQAGEDIRIDTLTMTVLPAVAAAAFAGIHELRRRWLLMVHGTSSRHHHSHSEGESPSPRRRRRSSAPTA